MLDIKLEDCKSKLSLIEGVENRLRVIYGWIKQDHISLKQFTELVKLISC